MVLFAHFFFAPIFVLINILMVLLRTQSSLAEVFGKIWILSINMGTRNCGMP